MKKFNIRKPYLDIHFDTGWVMFKTVLMQESMGEYAYIYIGLYWKIFKWNGQFRLYRPGRDS